MADPLASSLIIQGLVTLASGGTGAAVVTAMLSRRKTRAEADKTQAETGKTHAEITGVGASTAAAQVDTAMDMLRETREDMARLRAELDELKRWKTRHEARMDAHVRWDQQVWAELQKRGVTNIDMPPPLRDDSAT